MRHSFLLVSTAAVVICGAVLVIEVSDRSVAPVAAGVVAEPRPAPGADRRAETSPAPRAAEHAGVPPAREATVARLPAQRAAERRDTLRSHIRGSGTAPAPLATRAAAVLADWQRTVPAELAQRVQFGPLECHARGCFVEAVYPDPLAFEQVDESIVASAGFETYPGWRHRAGPIDDGAGKVTATWFFMALESP